MLLGDILGIGVGIEPARISKLIKNSQEYGLTQIQFSSTKPVNGKPKCVHRGEAHSTEGYSMTDKNK